MFDCLNCEVFFRVFVFFELCSILFAGLFDRALGAEIEPHARTCKPMTRRRAVPILLRSRKSILKDEKKMFSWLSLITRVSSNRRIC